MRGLTGGCKQCIYIAGWKIHHFLIDCLFIMCFFSEKWMLRNFTYIKKPIFRTENNFYDFMIVFIF